MGLIEVVGVIVLIGVFVIIIYDFGVGMINAYFKKHKHKTIHQLESC